MSFKDNLNSFVSSVKVAAERTSIAISDAIEHEDTQAAIAWARHFQFFEPIASPKTFVGSGRKNAPRGEPDGAGWLSQCIQNVKTTQLKCLFRKCQFIILNLMPKNN